MEAQLTPPALIDRYNRRVDYLRVSVTDRCDMRCSYCMPKRFTDYEDPAGWLTFDELTRVVGAFAGLGVRRVRLTGGEPLLRRNLPDLVGRIAALPGIEDIALSTNGSRLDRQAEALVRAGLKRVNISLDSLDQGCIEQITGRDTLDSVLSGIRAAEAAGLAPIKINMVVMNGVNDHEIERMAEFALDHGYILRLIELMPMGDTARAQAGLDLSAEVRERLVARYGLVPSASELGGGPARYWETLDGKGAIGFITPMSQHFCATCNRVRLTVEGTLLLCLGQEHSLDLRALLRAGISDPELADQIRAAIARKPERHEFREAPDRLVRVMSRTGG
ncbi:MAG TPA: GTP 3',8-cyclase MoaA [Parasulfuritortus sp.]